MPHRQILLCVALLLGAMLSRPIHGCILADDPTTPRSSPGHAHATQPDEPYDPDEQFLKESKVATDGPGLVKYLQQRSGHDENLLRLDELIRQLGSPDFNTRRQAAEKLIAVGPPAHARLLEAQKDKDKERARGAQGAAEEINRAWNFGLNLTVVRRLVNLTLSLAAKGAGDTTPLAPGGRGVGGEGDIAKALLQFLPYAADPDCEEEIWFGLDSIAKAQPQLVATLADWLKDRLSIRRAAAGYLFTRRGNADQRAAGKKLLADPDPLVRLRTAQGLLAAKDKDAIPVLIELLEKLRWTEEAWQAEEMLHYVAGDESPEVTICAGSTEARQKCRKAWEEWWKANSAKVDIPKLDLGFQRPGLILMATSQGEVWNRAGHVRLIGCDGKFRWELPAYAKHLQLLPRDRIMLVDAQLVGTYRPDVREASDLHWIGDANDRTLNGQIVWRGGGKYHPHAAYRLPNGNTFVLGRHCAVEITREGSEMHPPLNRLPEGWAADFSECRKLSNGRIVAYAGPPSANFTAIGEFDPATGQLLKKINVSERVEYGKIQTARNGNFWISEPQSGKTIEVDWSGKTVWRLKRIGWRPIRLRDGDTLFTINTGFEEVDRSDNVVWKAFLPRGAAFGRIEWFSSALGLARLGFDVPRPSDPALWVQLCIKQLTSQDPIIRHGAAWSLGELGPEAESANPQLIATLDDSNGEVRSAVSGALQQIGLKALPALLAASKDPRVNIRASAIKLLGDFKEQGPKLVPIFVEALNDDEQSVRASAGGALYRLGPSVPGVMRAIIAGLEAKKNDVRAHCATILSLFASNAKEALPELWKCLQQDQDPQVRQHAAEAIGKIGKSDKAVALRLTEMLRSKASQDQYLGAVGLASLGPATKESIKVLADSLTTVGSIKNPEERSRTAMALLWALGNMGGEAELAVPDMIKILQDKSQPIDVRKHAAMALGNIGPKARNAADALAEGSKDPRLSATCESAIRKINR